MNNIIIYIILCVFLLGLLSCGNDEPTAKTIEDELCGTWKSVGTYQIYDEYGSTVTEQVTFANDAYLIIEIHRNIIYLNQYFYNQIDETYESALLNWYYVDGYIYGIYSEYNGTNWENVNNDIDFWKIEVISKNKLKLWVKVVDFNRTMYAEYPFYKVSNDYSY